QSVRHRELVGAPSPDELARPAVEAQDGRRADGLEIELVVRGPLPVRAMKDENVVPRIDGDPGHYPSEDFALRHPGPPVKDLVAGARVAPAGAAAARERENDDRQEGRARPPPGRPETGRPVTGARHDAPAAAVRAAAPCRARDRAPDCCTAP